MHRLRTGLWLPFEVAPTLVTSPSTWMLSPVLSAVAGQARRQGEADIRSAVFSSAAEVIMVENACSLSMGLPKG